MDGIGKRREVKGGRVRIRDREGKSMKGRRARISKGGQR